MSIETATGMTDEELARIAREYGSPTFVFDIEHFQNRFRKVREIVGPDIQLCFCIKSNEFLPVSATQVAEKLEVCSPGELALCEDEGVDPKQIVYSGVNKQPEDIREAITYQVGVLTAESPLHVKFIEQEAAKQGVTVDVLLRLSAGSQFGMCKADLIDIIDRRAEYPHINIVGLHYFVGTQRKKFKHQMKELVKLQNLIESLREEHGFEVQRLEYGPGLAVPYFEDDDFSDDLAPIKELAPKLQEVASQVELTVEMGRFFAASCGVYLTKAMDMKSDEDTNFCILDGGINHLTYAGQNTGSHVPIITNVSHVGRETAPDSTKNWYLCGSLCSTFDVLVRSVDLEDFRLGDVLAFHNAGAYSVTEGIYLFLCRTMPRIVLRYDNQTTELARDFMESYPLSELKR